jgi:hypothetical protein
VLLLLEVAPALAPASTATTPHAPARRDDLDALELGREQLNAGRALSMIAAMAGEPANTWTADHAYEEVLIIHADLKRMAKAEKNAFAVLGRVARFEDGWVARILADTAAERERDLGRVTESTSPK